jgi:RND superfamily putative drug exporter
MTSPVRRRAVAGLLLGLVLAAVALVLGPSGPTTEQDAVGSLPASAQSTVVARQQAALPSPPTLPALVVFDRPDGRALDEADVRVVRARGGQLAATEVTARTGEKVATLAVPVATNLSATEVGDRIAKIRKAVRADLPAGLRAQVTGAPAFEADLASVFDGADVTLLLVTVVVVALLLLVTYRSPVLWLVPLLVVGLADRVGGVLAGAVAQALSGPLGLQVDDASAGILSVLVFGAGTDYALLLIARYRDELRRTPDRWSAMGATWRATAPAVLASGGTVTLALLTLLASDVPVTRGLGLVCAVGVVVAVAAVLLLLPAALALPGRWLFWPFVPRAGDPVTTDRSGGWQRLGAAVVRRPVPVLAVAALVLAPLLAPLATVRTGLTPTQQFLTAPESVSGQQVLAAALPGGAAEPLVVTAAAAKADQVVAAARDVDGVASVQTGPATGDVALLSVVLTAQPGTSVSDRSIEALRARLAQVPDARAAVGGQTAEQYDLARADGRDTQVVVPLIVVVVLLVLVLLLRALVAPLLLVGTVLLTWAAALGAGWLVSRHVYGFPAFDRQVPLLTFLFLVALGVDYNIFLVSRLREEVLDGLATRRAAVRALAATGGVITSAGVLLAAVFAVLGVLPVITLTQIGTVVGFGVLLDTLLVRTVVVPALAALAGHRFWWPGRPEQHAPRAGRYHDEPHHDHSDESVVPL